MKIEIKMEHGQDPMEALKEVVDKMKKVTSIKELRKLQEELNSMPYGYKEDESPEEEEESSEMENEVTPARNEGVQEMTPDDRAEKEDKETRIKNSKNPTIVGRMMK